MLRKAIVQMKKNTKKNVLRASFICLLIVAIAVGILAIPRGQNAGYAAPYIQLMNNAPAINLKDYLDSSVMFRLPVPHPLPLCQGSLQACGTGVHRA